MKKTFCFVSATFTLLLFAHNVFSQSSATWNLTSDGTSSVSGNLNAGAVSTGPGYRSGGISSMSYNSNGVSSTNWIGYSHLQFSMTSQYYNQDYYQYTVSPASGNNFTVNSISYEVSASTAPVSWFAYYSLDGFSTYAALGSRNATSHTDLNIHVPEGSTLSLRIYGMDLVSAGTAFRNKNVVISGVAASSCEAQTANAGGNISICKGQTTPALGGNVGGSATTGTWSSASGGTFTPNASDLNATWTPPGEFTGTAILTLTTTNGCSAHAASNKTITVGNSVQVNNPQTICQGGSYSINGNTYTSAGTYTDVLQNTQGCDSTVTTILTVVQPELNTTVVTSQDGTMFTASENNANYQWVRCDENNAPIGGATTQSFAPQQTGSYAVRLTSLQCPAIVDSSKCISINKDDVGIVGNLHVAGRSEFTGGVTIRNGVRIEGLEADSTDVNDSTELSLLFLRGTDGVLKTGGISSLLDFIYTPLPFQCFEGYSPIWSNKPGVLYTGLAPCGGNVGIGTDNPAARLHVMGSAIATGNLQIGREATSGAMITGYRQGTINFSLLKLGQYNPQTQTEFTALNLQSDGELTLNRNNNGNFLHLRNTDSDASILTVNESGELTINRENSGLFLHFRNTDLNTSVFTVDANGNLHLRNASRQIFHVNASNQTVFARKIVVDEEFWPDYVFEKDYKLKSLGEVKEFIEENGHLPNVPSQKEVAENGVDLGKMVHVLLEKVEELTLYTIQQQEEIERLKQLLENEQENEEK